MPAPSEQQHSPEPAARDLAAYLEATREELREQYVVEVLTPEERQVDLDFRWALQDATVQATYQGQFVVPYRGRVVAHGLKAEEVLQEAARVTGLPVQHLPLVGCTSPLLDLRH